MTEAQVALAIEAIRKTPYDRLDVMLGCGAIHRVFLKDLAVLEGMLQVNNADRHPDAKNWGMPKVSFLSLDAIVAITAIT